MNDDSNRAKFLDYIAILFKWKKFIIINFIIIAIIAVIISLILPKWYKATASVLPPKDQDLLNFSGATSSVLKGLTSLSKLGGFGQTQKSYNYFAILNSRTAMESVVKKFNLMSVYNISDSSIEKTIKQLKTNVAFELEDDDYISIEIYDKNPQRAADIANYFIEILNELSIKLGTMEARNNREFIEMRLAITNDSLKLSEEALKNFQEKSGIIITPDQTSSANAIAEIYTMKAKKEIELGILNQLVSPDNETYRKVLLEIKEIDKKIADIPQIGLESYRLYRDVITQQKILEFLLPLYEQARINEQKNIPVLLVLDNAIPPERHAKPQRSLIVLSISTLFLFFSIAIVFFMTGIINKKDNFNFIEEKLKNRFGKIASFYRIDVNK